jgi:hypothetical protein
VGDGRRAKLGFGLGSYDSRAECQTEGDIPGSSKIDELRAGSFITDHLAGLTLLGIKRDQGGIVRRGSSAIVVLALLALGLMIGNDAAASAHKECTSRSDFNGDGFADLAIGVPTESVAPSVSFAGAVNVLYGGPGAGLSGLGDQVWHQNSEGVLETAESADTFGKALATGDFDGDGFDDLAIGVPNEAVAPSVSLAGAVNVLYGSASGLTALGDQVFQQNTEGVLGEAGADDRFGSALSACDFDGDGMSDLAIGAPGDDVSGDRQGAVNVLYGSSSGLTVLGDQYWHQNAEGVLGEGGDVDMFGFPLAAGDLDGDGFGDLVIGVPLEDVSGLNQGAVNVLYGSNGGLTATGDQYWHQDAEGVLGEGEDSDTFGSTLAVGDFDSDGLDDLAIGVFSEDVAPSVTNAGAVNVLYGSSGAGLSAVGDQVWHQNSDGVLETAEAEDFWGLGLAAGDFDGDGSDDLAVGAPFEDVAPSITNGGAMNVLYGSSATGLQAVGDQVFHQNTDGVLGEAFGSDFFATSLSSADFDGDGFDDLVSGVPLEDVSGSDQGAVNVLYGAAGGGLTVLGDQYWHQDSEGVLETAENLDRFGSPLPGSAR